MDSETMHQHQAPQREGAPSTRIPVLSWVVALSLPAVAVLAYWLVQSSVLRTTLRWDHWLPRLFTLALLVASLATIALRLVPLAERWFLVILLSVIGFCSSFWLCRDAVGLFESWEDVTVGDKCRVSLPKGTIETRHTGWDANWGPYRWHDREAIAQSEFDSRAFTVRVVEFSETSEPPNAKTFLSWLEKKHGAHMVWKTIDREETTVEGNPAMMVTYKGEKHMGRQRAQVLFVAKGRRGFVCGAWFHHNCNWTNDSSPASNVETVQFLGSLKLLD
jgi:hypothetical protein